MSYFLGTGLRETGPLQLFLQYVLLRGGNSLLLFSFILLYTTRIS